MSLKNLFYLGAIVMLASCYRCTNIELFLDHNKCVSFSNGIHHHYNSYKIIPECFKDYFHKQIYSIKDSYLPLAQGEDKDHFCDFILSVIYQPFIAPKKVSLDASKDLVISSAVNFYEGVNQKEVSEYYEKLSDKNSKTPVMQGL